MQGIAQAPVFVQQAIQHNTSFCVDFLESPQYYMLIQDTEFYQLSVFGSIERFRTYTPALVPCKMAFVQQALEGNLLLCARFPAIIQKHDRVIGNEFFARSHPYRNRHAITRDISHKSGFRCPTVEDDHSLANGRPTRAVFRNTPDFLLMI